MDGWMDGCISGWMGLIAVLRIAYSNQKLKSNHIKLICGNYRYILFWSLLSTFSFSVFSGRESNFFEGHFLHQIWSYYKLTEKNPNLISNFLCSVCLSSYWTLKVNFLSVWSTIAVQWMPEIPSSPDFRQLLSGASSDELI